MKNLGGASSKGWAESASPVEMGLTDLPKIGVTRASQPLGSGITGWASSNFWGHNLLPLVEMGLTDLPKPGWAFTFPAHPSPRFLLVAIHAEKIKDLI